MYNLNIKGTGIDLTDAISSYVKSKMDMLEKYIDHNDESVQADVEVGRITQHHRSGDVFFAEINMHIARQDFYVRSEKDNLYAAMDESKEEMERKLTYNKDKKMSLMKKGAMKFKEILRGLRK